MDTIFTQLVNAGNGPVIRDGVDQGDAAGLAHASRTSRRPTRTRPTRPSTTTDDGTRPRAARPAPSASSSSTTSRAGRCTSAPRPTSGPTSCCASTTAPPGASWCGGCTPVVDSGRPSADPAHDAWITVAFTYQGLKALGVPQDSLDSFAPEFRQGMAARAAELGDVGESSPGNWEKPLGTPDVHVALAALSPDAARLEAVVEQARRAHAGASRRRADLAAGLLPAADRAHLVRLQGRDRPAGGRGQRQPTVEPEGAAAQGRRDHPRLPGRDRRAAADADAGGARPQRHLRRLPQAAHAGGGLPAVPPREGREPRGGGAARRQDGRALAERRSARARPGRRRSRARRRPAPQQRLPATATIRAASSARPARTRGARTRATRSTTTAASTCASTG